MENAPPTITGHHATAVLDQILDVIVRETHLGRLKGVEDERDLLTDQNARLNIQLTDIKSQNDGFIKAAARAVEERELAIAERNHLSVALENERQKATRLERTVSEGQTAYARTMDDLAVSRATVAQLQADISEIQRQHELAHLQLKDSMITNTTVREHLGQSQSDLRAKQEEVVVFNDMKEKLLAENARLKESAESCRMQLSARLDDATMAATARENELRVEAARFKEEAELSRAQLCAMVDEVTLAATDREATLRAEIARLNDAIELSHHEKDIAHRQLQDGQGNTVPAKNSTSATQPLAIKHEDSRKRTHESSRPVSDPASDDDSEEDPVDPEVIIVDSMKLNQFSAYMSMSSARQKVLDQLPEEIEDYDPEPYKYSRTQIKKAFGGSSQPTVVKITEASATDLAKSLRVTRILCPRLDMNPYLPLKPGQHGFMQVGLPGESERFTSAQVWLVFVGRPGQERTLSYTCLGFYEAIKDSSLTVGEWQSLPEEVKVAYSKIAASRYAKHHRSGPITAVDCRAAYDEGTESVPIVRLTYRYFDQPLFDAIACCHESGLNMKRPTAQSKRPRTRH